MKSSIWATCPKCQADLKIETNETELVQIECPDCHKVFAAKVPPRPTAPVRDVFAQAPVLPPFQPAHVHYKSQPRSRSGSDEGLSPVAVTALIFICASAILLPLGFGAYYVYGKIMESSQLAMNSGSASTSSAENSDSAVAAPPADPEVAFRDMNPPLISRPSFTPGPNIQSGIDTGQPYDTSTPNFPAPELNPPQLTQPDSKMRPGNPNSSPNMGSSQIEMGANTANNDTPGMSNSLMKFTAPNGVLIFVLHSRGTFVPIAELVSALSVRDSHIEGDSDHSTIGLSYTGDLQEVVKQIQFGKVTYIDEETRTIHVQAN